VMRFRTTILLLLVLLGLGAYIYWVELPTAEQEAKKKTLLQMKEDDVTELSLVYPDREIEVKKVGTGWRMTKPVEAAADSAAVKNVISAIAQAQTTKELKDAAALAEYGLDKPMVTAKVMVGDTPLPAILVGKTTPVGANTYVKKADSNQVVLTSSSLRSSLDKQAKDLRDKSIVSFEDAEVRKVAIEGEGKNIVLAQKDNQWRVEEPAAYAADSVAIRNFLSTLRSLRAVDFPAEQAADAAQYGLDKPRLKIVLTVADGAEKTVLLGKEAADKQIYVQRGGQPTIYTVNDWVLRDLDKNVGDFRDKTLLAFDRDKVGAVQVATKDGTVKLVRDGKQWHVEGAEGKPAEKAIEQYLGDLHALKGSEIAADQPADLAAFGLEQPAAAISVYGDDQKEIGTVLLGQRQTSDGKTEHTAMKAGGTTVFVVREYQVSQLDKKPDAFVEKPAPTGAPAITPVGTPGGEINPGAVGQGFEEDEPDEE
jgi:hypothetical protein